MPHEMGCTDTNRINSLYRNLERESSPHQRASHKLHIRNRKHYWWEDLLSGLTLYPGSMWSSHSTITRGMGSSLAQTHWLWGLWACLWVYLLPLGSPGSSPVQAQSGRVSCKNAQFITSKYVSDNLTDNSFQGTPVVRQDLWEAYAFSHVCLLRPMLPYIGWTCS